MSASGFLARGNIISANGRMVARWVGRRRRRTRGDVTGLPRYGTIVGPPIVMRLLGVRPDLPASAVSGTFSESTPSLSTLCVIENFRGDPTGAAAAVLPQPPPTGSAQGSAMVAGVQEDARLEARPCVRHASDARVSTVVPSERGGQKKTHVPRILRVLFGSTKIFTNFDRQSLSQIPRIKRVGFW